MIIYSKRQSNSDFLVILTKNCVYDKKANNTYPVYD